MEDHFQPPPANASPLPAAEIKAATTTENVEYQACPVRVPEEDLNDFIVKVRASTLTRCRTKLEQISEPNFPWHEMALGASTLAAGGFLGALPASMTAGTLGAIFFYTVFPIIAVASIVAYFFLRGLPIYEPASVVKDVLLEMPDPDKTR